MLTILRCWLGYHEPLREIDPATRSLFLRCVHCRRRSPGWVITDRPPRVIFRGFVASRRTS